MKQSQEEIDKQVCKMILDEKEMVYQKFKINIEKIKENFCDIKNFNLEDLPDVDPREYSPIRLLISRTFSIIKSLRDDIDSFNRKIKEIENYYTPISDNNKIILEMIRTKIIPNFEVCYKSQTEFMSIIYKQLNSN